MLHAPGTGKLVRRLRGRPAVISLSVALASASCLLVATSSSATVSSADSWPSGIPHPAAASCPHGETAVTATSGTTDAQGVVHLSYKSAPGMVASLPPAGLRASAVTPKLLADLGMRKGSSSAAQQSMAQQVAQLSAHRVAPAFCASAARPDSAKMIKTSARTNASGIRFAHVFSGNWGGYGVTQNPTSSTGINSVSGTFTVGNDRTLTGPGAESTWVGIGGALADGDTTWGLIQDGVSMITGAGYLSWFEYIGLTDTCTALSTASACDAQFTTTGVARPGDTVTAQAWWQSTTTACFLLTDVQHPAANINNCVANVPIPYDQTSGEWINENLAGQGFVMDNPGTINWTNQTYSGSFSAAGTGSSPFPGAEAVIMVGTYFPSGATSCGSGNGVLSYPSGGKTVSGSGQSSIVTCSVNLYDAP